MSTEATAPAEFAFPFRGPPGPGGLEVDWQLDMLRPIIPLDLIGPAGPVKLWGLVDSGADHSLFPLQVAAALGIDVAEDCMEISPVVNGAPRRMYRYRRDLEAIIGDTRIKITTPRFGEEDVSWPVLLGRSDFWPAFEEIRFDVLGKRTVLVPRT